MTAGAAAAPEAPSLWARAELAIALLALDPAALGGVTLRAPAGPVREALLARLTELLGAQPQRRLPTAISDARLLGGLDLTATLAAGRPVAERGLLAEADGGVIVAAMAERMTPALAARIATVLDTGTVAAAREGAPLPCSSRIGVLALDEGISPEERPPSALTERLALMLDLDALSHRDVEPARFTRADLTDARPRLASVEIGDDALEALCAAGLALGIGSARAPLQAVKTARMIAALLGRAQVAQEDAALAAALVLAPRATQIPAEPDSDEALPPPEPPEAPPPESDAPAQDRPSELEDVVLEAAQAAIPAGLLAQLLAQGGRARSQAAGKAGLYQASAMRGRIIGSKAGDLRGGARLDVVETLRAAAPWQALRRREQPGRVGLIIRRDDFRIARYRQRSETATLFVVDASGSSALQRLAEAKGAVRLLLAECYIRRDEVALIAFRKAQAELILPPTRSLVAAERALAALPGGGGTPLAIAIGAAAALADAVRRKGRTPALVFMTDGRANIDLDGQPGRVKAQADAMQAARGLRAGGLSALLIDTSPQPQPHAAALAQEMGARYVPLPHADAAGVGRAVNALLPGR
ncbi:MAG: magnesium chelatase subunit D [Bosea sp. (in: a-proteobacteria)]